MCLEEKIKAMFRKGNYVVKNVSEIFGVHSADIDMDGVSITAYPDTHQAIAVVSVNLTDEQAKELKRRLLEVEYNKRKEALSAVEIALQNLENG